MNENSNNTDYIIKRLEEATKVLVRRDLELKRAYKKLEEVDYRKSEFVSIAAHQLRTPLSAIRWAQQMLLDGDVGQLTDAQQLMVSQAQTSIMKMISLVNELLNADHLEYDKVQYSFKPVLVNLLITSSVDELQPLAEARDITMVYNPPSALLRLECDADRIKEALLNVISNAIKYSFSNSTVTIASTSVKNEVHITVSDNGIGIPENDTSRIFQKFTRADNAKRIDADGSGLGMFIAQKIIQAHHGTITFTSIEGKGTTFLITLPITSRI